MTDQPTSSEHSSAEEPSISDEDLAAIDSERPAGQHDTEELSADQIQELLRKSSEN